MRAVWTSPLLRARADRRGRGGGTSASSPSCSTTLAESRRGALGGQDLAELAAEEPARFAAFEAGRARTFAFPGGESLSEQVERTRARARRDRARPAARARRRPRRDDPRRVRARGAAGAARARARARAAAPPGLSGPRGASSPAAGDVPIVTSGVSSSSVGGPSLLETDPRAGARGRRHGCSPRRPPGAVPLPPTPDPLPGSGFQGADGDQADAAPWIDWTTLQTTGRVEHAPDPNAQDTAFKDGTKEDEPGEWDFVNEAGGVEPGAGRTSSTPGRRSTRGRGHVPLPRLRARGRDRTSFLTFELNRDDRLWDNGRARVPCRRDGDLLITFQPHGNDVEAELQSGRPPRPTRRRAARGQAR